jgi:hypothetical protein
MSGIRFVGANDGGSSTGALLEMARVLATAPDLAPRVELVFFDGEEAVRDYGPAETGPDGLIGSRHYARALRDNGRAAQFRFAIVWDMIGDADLTVTLPRDTAAELAGGIFTAAEALGARRNFGYAKGEFIDDHTPLQVIARIPAMDIIDFDYPPASKPSAARRSGCSRGRWRNSRHRVLNSYDVRVHSRRRLGQRCWSGVLVWSHIYDADFCFVVLRI